MRYNRVSLARHGREGVTRHTEPEKHSSWEKVEGEGMSKQLFQVVGVVAVIGLASAGLWGAGVFDSGDEGATRVDRVAAAGDASIEAGRATSEASGSGADLVVDPKSAGGARGAGSSKAKQAPKRKGPGIGRTGEPPKGSAIFPDGTWLPPLNGVTVAPPFPGFAPNYPYAPVIEIKRGDKGIFWYIHADGSHSTTQMALTEEGGRSFEQPAWVVGNPTETLPVQLSGKALGPRVDKN